MHGILQIKSGGIKIPRRKKKAIGDGGKKIKINVETTSLKIENDS